MRVAIAVAALLCLLCVTDSARLSVFREEFNGVPGRTFVILHGDGATNPAAAAFPGGIEWLARQMALLRAVQTHMMLSLAPGLPSDAIDTVSQQPRPEDILQRVGCQRMHQAMLDQEQDVWRSEFGTRPASSLPRPILAQRPLQCYNIHGQPVPCTSDEAVMQDNWMDIARPVDTLAAATPAAGQQADDGDNVPLYPFPDPAATPAADQQADSVGNVDQQADERDTAPLYPFADPAATPAGPAATTPRPPHMFAEDDGEEDAGIGNTWVVSSSGSSAGSGGNKQAYYRAGSDPDEDLSDLLFFDQDPQDRLQQQPLPLRREPRHEQPLSGGSLLLAAAGALCLALLTVAAAVLLVLAVVRRRHARCGGVDAPLLAPLLAPQPVCGVKVAAAEAAREDVKGIDTAAALLKGKAM